MRMISGLLIAFLLAFSPVAAPAADAPATLQATPALWVAKDADTTIYLFGTIHLLDPRYRWFDGAVKGAFDKSGELVVETVSPPPAEAQALVTKLAVDLSGVPLAQRLPPRLARKYAKALASAGISADAFDRFEPWFAGVTLSVMQYQKMGMQASSGVDIALIAAAQAAHKPVHPLEGFEQQLSLLSSLPPDKQRRFLALSVADMKKAPKTIAKLQTAWAKGDEDALAREMNKGTRKMPELSKLLLDDRNARFADWIKARLDQPGVVFVAVGAGHLGGKHSVQAMLAARGISTTRLR